MGKPTPDCVCDPCTCDPCRCGPNGSKPTPDCTCDPCTCDPCTCGLIPKLGNKSALKELDKKILELKEKVQILEKLKIVKQLEQKIEELEKELNPQKKSGCGSKKKKS